MGSLLQFPARGGPAEFVVRPSYLADRKKGSPWITRYFSRFTSDARSPSPHPHHIQNDGYASDFALDLSQRTDQINAYGSRCVAECYDLW